MKEVVDVLVLLDLFEVDFVLIALVEMVIDFISHFDDFLPEFLVLDSFLIQYSQLFVYLVLNGFLCRIQKDVCVLLAKDLA